MHITPISADVRIVSHGSPSHLLVVEQQQAGQWSRVREFDEVSNDFARSESRSYARQLAESIRNEACAGQPVSNPVAYGAAA